MPPEDEDALAAIEEGSLDWHDEHRHRGAWSRCWSGKCRRYLDAHDVPADEPRLQLIVLHPDNTFMYYPLSAEQGWKIDSSSRCLVVGKGVPRTYVPMDSIRSFEIAPIAPEASR